MVATGVFIPTYPIFEAGPFMWVGFWLAGLLSLMTGLAMTLYVVDRSAIELLATKMVNSAGADWLLMGNFGQLGIQVLAVAIVALYSAGATYLLLKVVDALVGLRVSPEEETRGLDASHHGERAYAFGINLTTQEEQPALAPVDDATAR